MESQSQFSHEKIGEPCAWAVSALATSIIPYSYSYCEEIELKHAECLEQYIAQSKSSVTVIIIYFPLNYFFHNNLNI